LESILKKLLLFLLLAPAAFGVNTFVSAGSGSNQGGGITTLNVVVTTGAHHVLIASNNANSDTTTLAITNSLGIALTCDNITSAGGSVKTRTCYSLDSGTGGANTFTCTSTETVNIGCLVAEYDMGGVPVLRAFISNSAQSSTALSASTTVTNAAGDLGVYVFGSGGGAVTIPSGYTCRESSFAAGPCSSGDASNYHMEGEKLSLSSGTQTVVASQDFGTWTEQLYVFEIPVAVPGTYYISTTGSDAANGLTSGTAFATFGKANSVVIPGDTVRVMAGTYNLGTGNVTTTTSGTATAPITWISNTKRTAILVSNNDAIWLNQANYLVIQDFVLTNNNASPGRLGIAEQQSANGGHTVIRGNEIRDIFGNCTVNGSAAIFFYNNSGYSDTIERNLIHDIGGLAGSHTTSCATDHGIWVGGTAQNVRIQNNIAFRNAGFGFEDKGATNSIYFHNLAFNNTRGGFSNDGDTGTVGFSNIIYQNAGISGCGWDDRTTTAILKDNFFWQNGSAEYCTNGSGSSGSFVPTGNRQDDPFFINYQANGTGDYHLLSPASRAIDAAASSYVVGSTGASAGTVTAGTFYSSSSAVAGSTSCSVTMTSIPANSLVLFSVVTDSSVVSGNTFGTPTASGLTFAPVGAVTLRDNAGAMQVFRAFTGSSQGSTAITSSGWSNANDYVCSAIALTGTAGTITNNGADAIGNSCGTTTSGTTASCTVSSSSHANSKYFGVFDAPQASSINFSAGSGFSQLNSAIFNSGFVNAFWELSSSPISPAASTAVSATLPASNSWLVQGIEILAGSGTSTQITVAAPSDDYDGAIRPGGCCWDIGPYESLALPPPTAGVPQITFLSVASGIVGSAVTITGSNFGATQGASTITIGGNTASLTVPSQWTDTRIDAAVVPAHALGSAPIIVTVGGNASNAFPFTITATGGGGGTPVQFSTVVTGNLRDLSTNPAKRAVLRFTLRNRGGRGVCRVNGIALLSPYFIDLVPDTNGYINQTVYSNEAISCNGITGSTYYGAALVRDGIARTSEIVYNLSGSSFNFNTAQPGTAPPPPPDTPPVVNPPPPPPAVEPPTITTVAAETANNTSACPSSGSVPTGCSALFPGLTDHCGQSDTSGGPSNGSCTVPNGHSYSSPGPPTTPVATNYQGAFSVPPAGNISRVAFNTLLYPGFAGTITTKIVCHAQLWFGTSSHIPSTKQTSTNSALADRQIQNMIDRGCNVVTIDWYGSGSLQNQVMQVWAPKLDARCANGTCPLYFAMMEDANTGTGSATIGTFETDLSYIFSNYMSRPSYWKVDDHSNPVCHSRPVLLSFGWSGFSSADWGTVKTWIHSNLATCNGEPALASEGEAGLAGDSNQDGAYNWVGVNGYDNTNPGTATVQGVSGSGQFNVHFASGDFGLDSWYTAAKNHPEKAVIIGVAYAGFNDTNADWGFTSSPSIGQGRKVARQCGQVWLNSWQRLASQFTSANQIPAVGLAVWDDYEEGTALEPGIDNCYSAPSLLISGRSLTITLNRSDATYANPNTIQNLTLYGTSNGADLFFIANLPATTQTIDLVQYAPPMVTGTAYTLYVKQNGKPGILNKFSSGVAYTP
jgi:hypothetical protein